MIITICSSLSFIKEIAEARDRLQALGHSVLLPKSAELVLGGELSQEELDQEKDSAAFAQRAIAMNAFKIHTDKIKQSDAIVVLNHEKRGVPGFIGGAVFLEMGIAHFLGKKIFVLHTLPDLPYKDELEMMQPVVLGGDFSKVV